MSMQKEIVITGFGGQGIILAGKILGTAAALGDHKESTLVQSYGPESRGGACSAQVMISDSTIYYPYARKPHILAAMSQAGFDKFIDVLAPDAIVLIDEDLVKPARQHPRLYAIPSTRMAEEMGRKMMANIIMLGFISAVTRAVSVDSARNAVAGSVPKGTEKANIAAFNKGFEYGLSLQKATEKKASGQTGAL
ncbi:MAG: 2-oxoacid:acceptor oxidoreductase family protein [Thermodesulfobacteriota bacterium]